MPAFALHVMNKGPLFAPKVPIEKVITDGVSEGLIRPRAHQIPGSDQRRAYLSPVQHRGLFLA
jgi:hypothetical protein